MSHQRSKTIKFTHYNEIHDNRASCPDDGHELVVDISHTSDTIGVEVDGKTLHIFDYGEWLALVKAIKDIESKG